VFLNNAPIYWSSKKQSGVETATFGSEFVAMKQACEYIRGLRYKLRMMGIPVDEPAFVFGDNQSVLCNTTAPASTLKKKQYALAYHFVREGVARDEWRTAYVNTHENLADLFTKTIEWSKANQACSNGFASYISRVGYWRHGRRLTWTQRVQTILALPRIGTAYPFF
jgi:hypothetical protein